MPIDDLVKSSSMAFVLPFNSIVLLFAHHNVAQDPKSKLVYSNHQKVLKIFGNYRAKYFVP